MSETYYPAVCGVLLALLADKPTEELTESAEFLERMAKGDPGSLASDAQLYVAEEMRRLVADQIAFDQRHAAREVA